MLPVTLSHLLFASNGTFSNVTAALRWVTIRMVPCEIQVCNESEQSYRGAKEEWWLGFARFSPKEPAEFIQDVWNISEEEEEGGSK